MKSYQIFLHSNVFRYHNYITVFTEDTDSLNEMSNATRKPLSGITDQVRQNPGCTDTEGGKRLEFRK